VSGFIRVERRMVLGEWFFKDWWSLKLEKILDSDIIQDKAPNC
jgi:hypothetical protein